MARSLVIALTATKSTWNNVQLVSVLWTSKVQILPKFHSQMAPPTIFAIRNAFRKKLSFAAQKVAGNCTSGATLGSSCAVAARIGWSCALTAYNAVLLTDLVTEIHVNFAKVAETDVQLLVNFVLPAQRIGNFHQTYARKLKMESAVVTCWKTVCAFFMTD